jgi:DNA-binding transcriptional LysR family regulator
LLDARRLRLLRDLAVRGTIAATAEAQHLTGPAVSQQLAVLEREAGLPLFTRQGRTLRLTAAGRLLVEHAEVILASLAAAEADLNGLRVGGRGQVRIAAFPSAARVLLPAAWRRLAQNIAGAARLRTDQPVDLQVAELEPDAAVGAVRRGEADIAVVHSYSLFPREWPPGCEQRHLLSEQVLLVLSPLLAARHRLRPGEACALASFASEDWLLPSPQSSCHELTSRACGAAGFVPRSVAVADDFSVLTALAAVGAGVALVPRMALPADTTGISLHPLTPPLTRTVVALTAAGDARQPHLSRVLDALCAAAARVPGAPEPEPAPVTPALARRNAGH